MQGEGGDEAGPGIHDEALTRKQDAARLIIFMVLGGLCCGLETE